MKAKNQNRTCPDGLSNECVIWEGGDVPCLGICNGDVLSEAEKTIADKICEIFSDIDMSTIDMTCLLDNCAQRCKDTSLHSVIQVLFDNQCCLKDLIDSINGSTVDVQINLNLRCLKKFDDFGNEIPQNLNQALQSIVNQVCQSATDIASLNIKVNDLQTQVDSIVTTPPSISEPKITTCITPGLRAVGQTVPLVAQAVCDLQSNLGALTDISGAISEQCSNINSQYQTVSGWQLSVNNLAQSVSNIWIVLCDLKSRIELIETNCCKVTCDDIKLGFDVVTNTTQTGVSLKFTSKAGTTIPQSFTDCGSSVTITDLNGIYVTYPLVISNDANQGDFDLSGLDLSDVITISVTAKLCTDGLSCEKCISRVYKISDTSCPVCAVTAAGTNGNVTITYSN